MLNSFKLKFSPVESKYEKLVLEWFGKEHVNEWFHGEGLQNSINSLKKFIRNEKTDSDLWLAFCNNEPFGHLITSIVDETQIEDINCPFAKWIEPGKKMITLDLLIGNEKYLGKGLATRMIREFISDKFPDAQVIFIDPELTNEKAIHVYERAGFEKLDEFIASWHPVPHLMMRLMVERRG